MKIYMDNCCLARPFDDQIQVKIRLEATAKMYIQSLVKFKSLVLCSSFMLSHEIEKCPVEETKVHISQFMSEFALFHVGNDRENDVIAISNEIGETGIRYKDSVHIACAIIAECDYLITTDSRILKYKTDKVNHRPPIRRWHAKTAESRLKYA